MNAEQARALVNETFPKAFDKGRFHQFVKELAQRFRRNQSRATMARARTPLRRMSAVAARLGTYESPDGESRRADRPHHRTVKLERARTALRDFVADKFKRGDSYKEAGLVAFVAPDANAWRFSYVRMEYESKRDPRRKNRRRGTPHARPPLLLHRRRK